MARREKLSYRYTDDMIIFFAVLLIAVQAGGHIWYQCLFPSLLMIIYLFLTKTGKPTKLYIILLFVMLSVSFVSIIFTLGDKQNALYEYEKLICFVLAFYIGMNGKSREKIYAVIVSVAVIAAILGLLAYVNIVRASEYIMFDGRTLRLQSFIKNANVAAVLLGVGYLFSLYFSLCKKRFRILCSCVNMLILIAFYLTLSKGAIAFFTVFGTFLTVLKKDCAARFVIQNIVGIVTAALSAFAAAKYMYIYCIFIIAIGAVSGIYLSKAGKPERKYEIAWFALLILLVAAALAVQIGGRFDLFGTMIARLDYMKDACKLLKDHWLVGIGPGGWKYYQFTVQSKQYNVTYIHNGWLQFLVENGIIFLISFALLVISALYRVIRKKDYILFSALMILLLHASIDVDLSFGIGLTLLGLSAGMALKEDVAVRKKPLSVPIVICAVLMIYMCGEYIIRSKFEHDYLSENIDGAKEYAEILEKICPYDSSLKLSIGALDETKTEVNLKKAIELSPLDGQLYEKYISYSLKHGDEDILSLCKKYILLAPKQERTYYFAKSAAEQALEVGKCSDEAYNEFINYLKIKREEEDVIDRNMKLDEIVNQFN